MKVLVLGGGGREHALCWALDRDPAVTEVRCAPGNAGIRTVAPYADLDPREATDVARYATSEGIDLVVVGPEAYLVAGVADALIAAEVPVFGPTAAAAQLEGSKAFAKRLMADADVPTGGYWAGEDRDGAVAALDQFGSPYVVKADGLAGGKGVRICAERAEAVEAVDDALLRDQFGAAGQTVVVEEFLDGPEVSVFALCDGTDARLLATARDYKRALDGDEGLNTGGMGAVSPAPVLPEGFGEKVLERVVRPTLGAMAAAGTPYAGVLYAGLVLTEEGPKVLEFNARFGDPEAQAVLPRLESGLGELLAVCARGGIADHPPLEFHERVCVTVVLASGGYPGPYETGKPIEGLAEAVATDGAIVFHAGTAMDDGVVVTAGGRVLAVSGLGVDTETARATAYAAADRISFDGAHRRSDIAAPRP